jgi:hypothetical protein
LPGSRSHRRLLLDSSRDEFGSRQERRLLDQHGFGVLVGVPALPRKPPYRCGDVRTRLKLRDEVLDLARGEVRCAFEERLAVLRSQERREPRQPAQVEPAVSEPVEQRRELAGRAGDRDAAVGLGLREVQVLRAVREHRGERLPGLEPSLVDLADVSDEIGLDAA